MSMKRGLAALTLAGFSALGMAATNDMNCQGLVGGAMAQCIQGMGSASNRIAPQPLRQESRVPAPIESDRSESNRGAQTSAGARIAPAAENSPASRSGIGAIGSSISGAISGLFSAWGSSRSIGVPMNCRGLVGGAMSQCVQGIGQSTASVPVSNESPSENAVAHPGASFPVITTNMSFGNNSLNCQGLVGGAMAQCLQGLSSASSRNGAASR